MLISKRPGFPNQGFKRTWSIVGVLLAAGAGRSVAPGNRLAGAVAGLILGTLGGALIAWLGAMVYMGLSGPDALATMRKTPWWQLTLLLTIGGVVTIVAQEIIPAGYIVTWIGFILLPTILIRWIKRNDEAPTLSPEAKGPDSPS
jgi:hypothetical protein